MPTKDAYRVANLLIKQHGENAISVATDKLQGFLKAEDTKASAIWLHICEAIETLQVGANGKSVH